VLPGWPGAALVQGQGQRHLLRCRRCRLAEGVAALAGAACQRCEPLPPSPPPFPGCCLCVPAGRPLAPPPRPPVPHKQIHTPSHHHHTRPLNLQHCPEHEVGAATGGYAGGGRSASGR
jgi:hypothetical protein